MRARTHRGSSPTSQKHCHFSLRRNAITRNRFAESLRLSSCSQQRTVESAGKPRNRSKTSRLKQELDRTARDYPHISSGNLAIRESSDPANKASPDIHLNQHIAMADHTAGSSKMNANTPATYPQTSNPKQETKTHAPARRGRGIRPSQSPDCQEIWGKIPAKPRGKWRQRGSGDRCRSPRRS